VLMEWLTHMINRWKFIADLLVWIFRTFSFCMLNSLKNIKKFNSIFSYLKWTIRIFWNCIDISLVTQDYSPLLNQGRKRNTGTYMLKVCYNSIDLVIVYMIMFEEGLTLSSFRRLKLYSVRESTRLFFFWAEVLFSDLR
jgi:hypothetical protein